jgi:hypothetical protein
MPLLDALLQLSGLPYIGWGFSIVRTFFSAFFTLFGIV